MWISYCYVHRENKSKNQYFIFSLTPVGTPTVMETASELCCETLRWRPYSTIAPKVPALNIKLTFDHSEEKKNLQK